MSAMLRINEFRFKVAIPDVDIRTWDQMVACISGINSGDFWIADQLFHKGTCRLELLSLLGGGMQAEMTYRPSGWKEASHEEMISYADFGVFQRAIKELYERKEIYTANVA